MLDDFHCPAIDQKRRDGRIFLSPKIHNHCFCCVYIELQIVFAAQTDKFVHLMTIFRLITVGNKP